MSWSVNSWSSWNSSSAWGYDDHTSCWKTNNAYWDGTFSPKLPNAKQEPQQHAHDWQTAKLFDAPPGSVAASIERGFLEEEAAQGGGGGEILDFLKLLPSKDWVPFGSFELEPQVGVWGSPAGDAVDFYLRPNLMPVGGFGGWKAHSIYEKDLAFVKKDTQQEVRLNKEIATRWTSADLLAFAEVRSCEFDIANVITTVHRIAKSHDRWFIKRDPRLKHVIAQAVGMVCDPERAATARDVAKTIWSMARVSSNDKVSQERISQEILRRVEHFEPQGLSNILWSYARLGAPRQAVLESVVHHFHRMVVDRICEPQALSNVAWAFAKLVVLDVPTLCEVAIESRRKANEFDPQGLANIVWAFATLQQEDLSLFEDFAAVLAANPSGWQPQNIANFSWAYAKLLVTNKQLFNVVANETVATIDDWNAQGLANIAWAFAKLGVNHGPLFGKISAVTLQRMRSFSPQNTVNIAWAFAKLCLARAELMDAVAEDVITKAADFNPQHCSNIAWAFGTAGILNEEMMESLALATERCACELNGQDMANIVWSCAKLVSMHARMLAVISEEVISKVSTFSAQNIAITVWSLGCLAFVNGPMMAAIASECPRRADEFGAQGFSNLAHGFAKLGILDSTVMEYIGAEVAKTITAFTNQEFTMTAWAYAKLVVAHSSIVHVIISEMKRRINDLLPQDLATLAWSFARLGALRSKEALEELSWEVLKQVADLGAQDLSNISWAFATAAFENTLMMEAISLEVTRKIDKFSGQDISNTAWAFAKLGIATTTTVEMFDSLALATTNKISQLLPQNLSIISWSFAKLGLVNDAMMDALAFEVIAKVQGFDGQGVGNILWSFGVLGLKDYEAMTRALIERALEIADQLTPQEISNAAWGLFVLHHKRLLLNYLHRTVCQFDKVAQDIDGASWVDFANVVAETFKPGSHRSDVDKLDTSFRQVVIDPLMGALVPLKDSGSTDLDTDIQHLQHTISSIGAPYFGSFYSWEVMSRLSLNPQNNDEAWASEARRQCYNVVGGWQIPNMDSIVAYASWEVWNSNTGGRTKLLEPGRVFLSGWSEGISDTLKNILHPFMQLTRRDMCAERVALLELLDLIAKQSEEKKLDTPSDFEQLFKPFEGHVQLYLSHFPSLSSIGVFCQFQRRLPKVHLKFDFDNAWLTCCGVPRYED